MSRNRRRGARALVSGLAGAAACLGLVGVAAASPDANGFWNQLNAVSCPTTTSCEAVGYYYATVNGPLRTLVEEMTGSTWTVVPSPNASPTLNDELDGVSCVSATRCWAVGSYRTGATDVNTLVEYWNGIGWSIVNSPHPGAWSFLNSVSCVSVTRCVAVGYTAATSGGNDLTLTERWNGISWIHVTSPSPSTSFNDLLSVSCASATSCKAVGNYYRTSNHRYRTLIESLNGNTWTLSGSPDVGVNPNGLTSVSCRTATVCNAVGGYVNSSGNHVTLVEHLVGTAWSVTPSPNIGTGTNLLQGDSCALTNRCVAVGYDVVSSTQPTLAEKMVGTTWTVTPSPNIGTTDTLLAVSCVAYNRCKAVGTYFDSGLGTNQTLIESWNGVTWSLV